MKRRDEVVIPCTLRDATRKFALRDLLGTAPWIQCNLSSKWRFWAGGRRVSEGCTGRVGSRRCT